MLPCQGDSLSGSVRYILVFFRVYFISSRDWHRSVEWKKVLTLGKCWCVYLGGLLHSVCRTSGSARFWISRSSRASLRNNADRRSARGIVWAFDERMRVFFHANISSPLASRRAVSSHTILGISSDSGDRSSSDKSILSGLFLDTTISRFVLSWTHGE